MNKTNRIEYDSLKKKYYSLKEKVISSISNGCCIIPEKTLIDLRDKYEAKFLELLKLNDEISAKQKAKKEFDSIAQKYYINNISKEFKEQSRNEINELEQILDIYEASFGNSYFKEGLMKIAGKTKISKTITAIQLLNAALCFFDANNIAKNILEIALMQYSKYELDKHLYKKNNAKITDEQKINALKEGIEYLDSYFEKKGMKVIG